MVEMFAIGQRFMYAYEYSFQCILQMRVEMNYNYDVVDTAQQQTDNMRWVI